MDIVETDDYIHVTVRDAGDFIDGSFRTITISENRGIEAVIGKLKSDAGGSTHVQQYIFRKDKGWTKEKARQWVTDHEEMHKMKTNLKPVIWRGYPLNRISGDEDSALIVRSFFTSDKRDTLGLTITREATEDAVARWKWRNVRFMHELKPIGKVIKIGTQDGLKWNQCDMKIVDPESILLVKEGVLSATSVGINVLEYEEDPEYEPKDLWDWMSGGGMIVKKYDMVEISLVDHPANYDAFVTDVGTVLRAYDGNHVVLHGLAARRMQDSGLRCSRCGRPLNAPSQIGVVEGGEVLCSDCWNSLHEGHVHPVLTLDKKVVRTAWVVPSVTPDLERAEWTTAEINDARDLVFAVVEPTGEKDDEGKTVPRNARHLPHHNLNARVHSDANVDLPHYRNALARVSQIKPVTDTITTDELRSRAQAHLDKHRKVLEQQGYDIDRMMDDREWQNFLEFCGNRDATWDLWMEYTTANPPVIANEPGPDVEEATNMPDNGNNEQSANEQPANEQSVGDDLTRDVMQEMMDGAIAAIEQAVDDAFKSLTEAIDAMSQVIDEIRDAIVKPVEPQGDNGDEQSGVAEMGGDANDSRDEMVGLLRDIKSGIESLKGHDDVDSLRKQIKDLQAQIEAYKTVASKRAPVPDPESKDDERVPSDLESIRKRMRERIRQLQEQSVES